MLGNWNRLREPRLGVMLHYDGSVTDAGAVEWLTKDPRCHVSYTDIVLDDGTVVAIAPRNARAWHAGVCRPSATRLGYHDANSAFYGLAIAAKEGQRATEAQVAAVLAYCRARFREHGWPLTDTWRVVSHAAEAWKRGRKIDPEGPDAKHPVLSTALIRTRLLPPARETS